MLQTSINFEEFQLVETLQRVSLHYFSLEHYFFNSSIIEASPVSTGLMYCLSLPFQKKHIVFFLGNFVQNLFLTNLTSYLNNLVTNTSLVFNNLSYSSSSQSLEAAIQRISLHRNFLKIEISLKNHCKKAHFLVKL